MCPCVVVLQELDLASSFVNKAALIVKRKLEQKEPKHKPDRKDEKKAPVTQEPEPEPEPKPEPTKNKPNVKPVRELPIIRQATVPKDVSRVDFSYLIQIIIFFLAENEWGSLRTFTSWSFKLMMYIHTFAVLHYLISIMLWLRANINVQQFITISIIITK